MRTLEQTIGNLAADGTKYYDIAEAYLSGYSLGEVTQEEYVRSLFKQQSTFGESLEETALKEFIKESAKGISRELSTEEVNNLYAIKIALDSSDIPVSLSKSDFILLIRNMVRNKYFVLETAEFIIKRLKFEKQKEFSQTVEKIVSKTFGNEVFLTLMLEISGQKLDSERVGKLIDLKNKIDNDGKILVSLKDYCKMAEDIASGKIKEYEIAGYIFEKSNLRSRNSAINFIDKHLYDIFGKDFLTGQYIMSSEYQFDEGKLDALKLFLTSLDDGVAGFDLKISFMDILEIIDMFAENKSGDIYNFIMKLTASRVVATDEGDHARAVKTLLQKMYSDAEIDPEKGSVLLQNYSHQAFSNEVKGYMSEIFSYEFYTNWEKGIGLETNFGGEEKKKKLNSVNKMYDKILLLGQEYKNYFLAINESSLSEEEARKAVADIEGFLLVIWHSSVFKMQNIKNSSLEEFYRSLDGVKAKSISIKEKFNITEETGINQNLNDFQPADISEIERIYGALRAIVSGYKKKRSRGTELYYDADVKSSKDPFVSGLKALLEYFEDLDPDSLTATGIDEASLQLEKIIDIIINTEKLYLEEVTGDGYINNNDIVNGSWNVQPQVSSIKNRLNTNRMKFIFAGRFGSGSALSDTQPKAILAENLSKVNRLLNQGKSSLYTAFQIAANMEYVKAFFTPRAFINAHENKTGAKIVVFAGIAAGIVAAIATVFALGGLGWSLPVIAIAAVLTSFAAGSAVNIAIHTFIDYQYLNRLEPDMKKAIEKFGAASIDAEGNIHTNIYFMGMPDNPEMLELKNTGLKVDGKHVWASTYYGALVLFSEADSAKIQKEIDNAVQKQGKVNSSAKTINRLKTLMSKAKVDTSAFDNFEPGIIIDHNSRNNAGMYNENGSLVVSADIFDSENKNDIADKLGYLSEIRKVDAKAVSKKVFIYMDNISGSDEFIRAIEAFNVVGNSRMIADYEVFEGMSDEQIAGILKLAKANSVEICVNLKNSSDDVRLKYRMLGFAGYAIERGNKMHIYDAFSSVEKGNEVSIIEGYSNVDSMMGSIRKSSKNYNALRITDLENMIKGGERSIIDRVSMLELFRTAVLKLCNSEMYSPEHVKNAGYAWDNDKLPSMPANIDSFIGLINSGNIEDVLAELGAANTAIGFYLKQIRQNTANEQEYKSAASQFLTAITEKMLAKNKLAEKGMQNGLANENLEILLGQKLFERQISKKDKKAEDEALALVSRFIADNSALSIGEFFGELDKMIMLQSSSREPKAINAVIELILLSERKMKQFNYEKTKEPFDVVAVSAILKAA